MPVPMATTSDMDRAELSAPPRPYAFFAAAAKFAAHVARGHLVPRVGDRYLRPFKIFLSKAGGPEHSPGLALHRCHA